MYKIVSLGEIANVTTGFPFKGNLYSDEGTRVVRGENVTVGSLRWDSTKCWNSKFEQTEKYSLKEDDVVIGMDGSRVGKNRAQVKARDLPLLLAQRVACIRSTELTDQNYLYYLIRSEKFEQYVNKIQTGSSIPHISLKQIEEFPVAFPPLATQRRIASVLSSLDSKIELNNHINAELEAMAKTLYDYWFVQFDFPDENGKPYKTSGGKMVWNEELKREVPEGWEVGELNKLGDIIGGSTPSKAIEENFCQGNGMPWITPKDLSINKGKKYITRGELDVTERGLKDASLKIMPAGTVLLSSRAPIGYLAISRLNVTTNQGFKSFVPNAKFSTEFIFYTIKNLIPEIEANSSGSTFQEVSTSTLRTIKTVLPTNDYLTNFDKKIKSIFKQ